MEAHTRAGPSCVAALDAQSDGRPAGAGRRHRRAARGVRRPLRAAPARAILIWSMGITQHRDAVDGVRAIVNVGAGPRQRRPRRRRAHADPGALGRAGRRRDGRLRHGVPRRRAGRLDERRRARRAVGLRGAATPGRTAPEMVEAAAAGELDVLWTSGGNFLEVLPDPDAVRAALGRVPLRVHQDIVLTSQMLVEGDDVLLLPVATRYEQEGGGTETTTERRIIFSPEIPRQVGEARSEWRLFADVATRVRPDLAAAFGWADNQAPAGGDRRGRPGLRRHRDAGGHRRPGAVGRPPPVRRRRVPHARRPRALHRARAPGARTSRRVRSRSPPAGASSSTRWCTPRSTRSPAPAATPSTSTSPMPPPSVRGEGTRVRLHERDRHVRRAAARSCASRPARSRCTGPRATCSSPAAPASASPVEGPRLQRRGHDRGARRESIGPVHTGGESISPASRTCTRALRDRIY